MGGSDAGGETHPKAGRGGGVVTRERTVAYGVCVVPRSRTQRTDESTQHRADYTTRPILDLSRREPQLMYSAGEPTGALPYWSHSVAPRVV